MYHIDIQASKVAEDLYQFPVYVNLDHIKEGGLTIAEANSIRVYQSDGVTELPREIVSRSEMHFLAEQLSSTTNTRFVISIDGLRPDYTPTHAYGRDSVWVNGFAAVWHLNSLTGTVVDSTGNSNDGVNDGMWQDPGVMGAGASSDGSTNYNRVVVDPVGSSMAFTHNDDMTITAWVKPVSWAGRSEIVGGRRADNIGVGINSNGTIEGQFDDIFPTSTGTVSFGDWNYVSVVHNGDPTESTADFYINGAYDSSGSSRDPNGWTAPTYMYIGHESRGNSRLNGTVDEVRFSRSARSAGWIEAEYINQGQPLAFYVISPSGSSLVATPSDTAVVVDSTGMQIGRAITASDVVVLLEESTQTHGEQYRQLFDSRYDDLFMNEDTPLDTKPFNSGDRVSLIGYRDGDPLELPEGFYMWRVRALDPDGSNAWGAWTGFRRFEIQHGKAVATDDEAPLTDSIAKIIVKITADAQGTASAIQKSLDKLENDNATPEDYTYLGLSMTIGDIVELSDYIDFGKVAQGNDEIFTGDAAVLWIEKAIAEAMEPTDAVRRDVVKDTVDTSEPLDDAGKAVAHQRADDVLAADHESKKLGIPASDSVSFEDAVVRAVSKLIEEILKPEDNTVQDLALPFSDALNLIEGIRLAVGKYIDGDGVETSDASDRKPVLGVSDSLEVVEGILKAVAKYLDDEVEIIDAPTYAAQLYRSLGDAVEATDDEAIKAVGQYYDDEAPTADASTLATGKYLQESLEALDAISLAVAMDVYDEATANDEFGVDFTMGVITDEVWVTDRIAKHYHHYAPEEYVTLSDEAKHLLRQRATQILKGLASRGRNTRELRNTGLSSRGNNASENNNGTIKARRLR